MKLLCLLAASGLLLSVNPVLAQSIATRGDLNALLGANAENENLSGLPISGGGAVDSQVQVVNSSNYLTQSDLSFSLPNSGIFQFDSPGYYGATENEILVGGGDMAMNFSGTVNAFGVDLRTFDCCGNTQTITIYGANDTTVLATFANVALNGNGVAQFFGYDSSSAIGEVVFSDGSQGWSAIVGNITYGAAESTGVPEPASLAALGTGLLALGMIRRRRA